MTNAIERISPAELGNRLRVSRVRADLTQGQAANAIGLARTTLIAIEKGERRIRRDELINLASLYRASLNELLRDHSVHVDLEARFRALPATRRTRAEAAVNVLNALAAAEVELEQLLGRVQPRIYPPVRPIGPGDVDQQAEDAALEFRHRLGRGLSPIKDLIPLLESELSIRIFIRPLPHGPISGLFAYDEAIGACILLNENHPPERRLQSAAHETGHFVSTRHQPDIDSQELDTNSREERFAKQFGYSLLMPAQAIRTSFSDFVRDHGRFSPRHLVVMSHRFGVTTEACCRRLEDLQLLPQRTWESLKDRGFSGEFARRLLHDAAGDKENGIAHITPRLWLLTAEAYERELVSEEQLARMLQLNRIEVRRVLDTLDVEGIDDLQSVKTDV